MNYSLRLLRFSVTVMMMSLMILSCTKKESAMEASTVSVNLDDALSLKEAALSMDVFMLTDSLSSHFPGNINRMDGRFDIDFGFMVGSRPLLV